MRRLEEIGEKAREHFERKNAARERALQQSRTLIRHCSKAIRAAHRDERELALDHIRQAGEIADHFHEDLDQYPDLYHAGYTQDALKEYAEASIVYALFVGDPLPDPSELGVEYAAYMRALGEVAGELRRRVLDLLREDDFSSAEQLLEVMDDIYGLLVTLDFPSAITNNLRRTTDMVRGVTERTRGDLTTSGQQRKLRAALSAVEKKLNRDPST
jgi:translin